MPRTLPREESQAKWTRLSYHEVPFRIVIEEKLDNGYELKDMTRQHITENHRFLCDTEYKELTITEVGKLYLCKEGLSKAPVIESHGLELIHYGKYKNPFRIFGYYNTVRRGRHKNAYLAFFRML